MPGQPDEEQALSGTLQIPVARPSVQLAVSSKTNEQGTSKDIESGIQREKAAFHLGFSARQRGRQTILWLLIQCNIHMVCKLRGSSSNLLHHFGGLK